ncbi:hypothetical protein ACSQ67_012476 [Phaseolus vulgaris]
MTLFLTSRLGYIVDGVVGSRLKSNISRHHLTLLNESGDEDQTAAATEEDVAPAATEENADMEAGRDGAGSYEAGQNAGNSNFHTYFIGFSH